MSSQAFSAFRFPVTAGGNLFDIGWHSATVENAACNAVELEISSATTTCRWARLWFQAESPSLTTTGRKKV